MHIALYRKHHDGKYSRVNRSSSKAGETADRTVSHGAEWQTFQEGVGREGKVRAHAQAADCKTKHLSDDRKSFVFQLMLARLQKIMERCQTVTLGYMLLSHNFQLDGDGELCHG